MKLVLTILISLVVAVGLGLLAAQDSGYVVLAWESYRVRLPLLMFVMVLFLGFMLLYLATNLVVGIFRAPRRLKAWREASGEKRAHQSTMLGYAGLIEGDWPKAEKSLLKKLSYNRTPLMNYLGAAYAAHQQGSPDRRNRYLDKALENHPDQQLAVNLTRARLLFQGGEFSESKACLETLRQYRPRNVSVVRLLMDVYRELGDWPSLMQVLPVAAKLKALPEEELLLCEQVAFDNMMGSPALLQGDSGKPSDTWNSLPKGKKRDPQLVASYVHRLVRAGQHKEAEKILRSVLNRQFDNDLIYLYGNIHSPFLSYQIELAESFLKKHPDNADLLHSLAKLHRLNNDFKQSREFFERAIAAGARTEVNLDYAGLLEQMGDTDQALSFMKKGAASLVPDTGTASPETREGEWVLLEGDPEKTKEIMPVVR
ncbi:MAG: hypothetical protein OXG56_06930 [Gammaproteobacteria bacterium]|nr:hypothetical protein [Gammaproteobacteria bacterium]